MAKKRKSAATPRDLKAADAGVPRGDWSDDPLHPDGPGEGLRSNFDGHHNPRIEPDEELGENA